MTRKEFDINVFLTRFNKLLINDICMFENPATFDEKNETELDCLKSIISEAKDALSCYYEEGHDRFEMKFSEYECERKQRISEIGKIKRFIAKYEPYIELLSKK